jgi:UDP-N-acetylmuramyl pentapeptide synthase
MANTQTHEFAYYGYNMEILLTWTTIETNDDGLVSYRVFDGPHDRSGAWDKAVDMCSPDTAVIAIVPGNHTPHSERDAAHALAEVSRRILTEND